MLTYLNANSFFYYFYYRQVLYKCTGNIYSFTIKLRQGRVNMFELTTSELADMLLEQVAQHIHLVLRLLPGHVTSLLINQR